MDNTEQNAGGSSSQKSDAFSAKEAVGVPVLRRSERQAVIKKRRTGLRFGKPKRAQRKGCGLNRRLSSMEQTPSCPEVDLALQRMNESCGRTSNEKKKIRPTIRKMRKVTRSMTTKSRRIGSKLTTSRKLRSSRSIVIKSNIGVRRSPRLMNKAKAAIA